MEALDEPQMNSVTQPVIKANSEETKWTRHYCKKPGHYRNQCRQLRRQKEQTKSPKKGTGVYNSRAANSNPNNHNKNKNNRKPRTVYLPSERCVKTCHSTEENRFETDATNKSPPWKGRPTGQPQSTTGHTK